MNNRILTALLLILIVCAVLAGGCGRDSAYYRWEKRLLSADSHVDHEDYDRAEAAYRDLLETATRSDDRRYIRFRLARIAHLRGNYREAIRRYRALWEAGEDDEIAGHCLFFIGSILYRSLDRPGEGLETFGRLVTARPDSVAAGKALREILGHYERTDDPEGALAFLEKTYPLLRETPIGDNLMYRYARLHREEGNAEEAIDAYQAMLKNHVASGLHDDARWELAEVYRELGRYDEALTQLRFLTESHEESWLVGSYDSEFVNDARFHRGLIYLEDLKKSEEAIEEFVTFLDDFPESLLRDDARWNIVQAHLLRGDGEGAKEACRELEEAEPKSRWVDECRSLVDSLNEGAQATSLRGEIAQ